MMKKNKGGHPKMFKSPKELQKKIDSYFKKCDKNKEPYTITGLALSLDTSRQTLLNYEKVYPEFFDTIKRAKVKVENYVEKYLFQGKNTVGAIFNLKNNFDWKDKQEIDHTTKGKEISGFNYVSPTNNKTDAKTASSVSKTPRQNN